MLKESVAKESRSPTQEEVDQLLTFAANRNSSRDSLFSALDAMQLYFGEAPANLGVQFRAWDEEQSLKRSSELPRISTWQQRERTLLNAMREELLK